MGNGERKAKAEAKAKVNQVGRADLKSGEDGFWTV